MEWTSFIRQSTLTVKITDETGLTADDLVAGLSLVRNFIIVNESLTPNSYIAALIVDFIRHSLIQTGQSFVFETVMSSTDKLEIMRKARASGFRVVLYYVTTRDPVINVARVRSRVAKNGHSVSEEKIRKRYTGSLENLAEALRLADEAYLFDNSTDGSESIEVARKADAELTVLADDVPQWYMTYVENRFLNS